MACVLLRCRTLCCPHALNQRRLQHSVMLCQAVSNMARSAAISNKNHVHCPKPYAAVSKIICCTFFTRLLMDMSMCLSPMSMMKPPMMLGSTRSCSSRVSPFLSTAPAHTLKTVRMARQTPASTARKGHMTLLEASAEVSLNIGRSKIFDHVGQLPGVLQCSRGNKIRTEALLDVVQLLRVHLLQHTDNRCLQLCYWAKIPIRI